MKVEPNTIICQSDEVQSGSTGFKFYLISNSQQIPAFVIRFKGEVYGYFNRCAHLMLELDWDDAEFFDTSGELLVCSNHGAMFEPDTGLCVNGPCYGASLESISVTEVGSDIVLADTRFQVDSSLGEQSET